MSTSHRFAFPALLAGAACIAFAGILVRMSEVGPVMTGFWRMVLAAPILFLLGRRLEAPGKIGRAWPWVTGVGAFFALDLAVWHIALHITTVANATLLANCVPVFCVPLLGWLIWRDRIDPTFWASFAVTLVGVGLLTGENVSLNPERFQGDLLAGLAASFYCGYLLLLKQARASVPVMRLMAASSAVAALVLAGIGLVRGESIWPMTLAGWGVLVALALVTQVGGQTLIAYGLGHLPAHVSALGLMFQPVVAAAAAWGLFGERISGLQFTGAAVILVGVWLAKRQR